MKVLHLSTSDSSGGAARAAYRIHQSLVGIDVASDLLVLSKNTSGAGVYIHHPTSLLKILEGERHRRWLRKTKQLWKHSNKELHSFGRYGVGLVDLINHHKADVIHLHWINDMLSIKDIGRIQKPIIWTMHDMWSFCGAEHYAQDDDTARFRLGYHLNNRTGGESGIDFNKKIWDAKMKYWKRNHFSIVSTSNWLYNCARSSMLFSKSTHYLIPYPLSTSYPWSPVSKDVARTALQLPMNCNLILMGADGGVANPRKGGDLLRDAVQKFVTDFPGTAELVIFGQEEAGNQFEWPCKVNWLGSVRDDRVLSLAYSASDVIVLPSRQEAFGQIASEAMACGTPVAAFETGGLKDIVTHKETGWLAKPFDTADLATGIQWILADENRRKIMGQKARVFVQEQYAPAHISNQYLKVYQAALQHPK